MKKTCGQPCSENGCEAPCDLLSPHSTLPHLCEGALDEYLAEEQ